MPKFDVILKPGEAIPDEFAPFLNRRLTPALRQKLLKHGGLIRVSVASPYVDRKEARKNVVAIDDQFIRDLEAVSGSSETISERLRLLQIKQLLEICSRLGIPIGSKESSREIREAIVQRLRSGHVWDGIASGGSGSVPDLPPSKLVSGQTITEGEPPHTTGES